MDFVPEFHRKRRVSYNEPGHAHEFTFSVWKRLPMLTKPGVPEIFIDSLRQASTDLAFDIWAYVVMPEHAHILLYPREESYKVADILKAIKSPSSAQIFQQYPEWRSEMTIKRSGDRKESRFWQVGGGYDRNFISGKAAWASVEYIHFNPVKRGLCERMEDWPWSSARAYVLEDKNSGIVTCPWSIQ